MNTKTKEEIIARLQEHLEFAQQHYPQNTILGIFLQGSQNYGLDTEKSDIDSKAILIPTFDDVVVNKKPVSVTLVLPNNEHCDVKDIRLMFNEFRKQNINFLEILFTDFNIVNSEYAELFLPMVENREAIARYDNYRSIDSMAGMVLQKYKSMCHPTPATQTVIEQHGYNGKDLCHMLRIRGFMIHFHLNNFSFEDCLQPNRSDYINLMHAKECHFSEKYAKELASEINVKAKLDREIYLKHNKHYVNEDVDLIINNTLNNILRHAFKSELYSN